MLYNDLQWLWIHQTSDKVDVIYGTHYNVFKEALYLFYFLFFLEKSLSLIADLTYFTKKDELSVFFNVEFECVKFSHTHVEEEN